MASRPTRAAWFAFWLEAGRHRILSGVHLTIVRAFADLKLIVFMWVINDVYAGGSVVLLAG
jgi:hypothetical protein